MKKVRIVAGTHGNQGAFYVFDATGAQIATYLSGWGGERLIATFHNGRMYKCSKMFKSSQELFATKNWEVIE